MANNCIHYFVEGHTSKGFVSYADSNFGTLNRLIELTDYPPLLTGAVISAVLPAIMEAGYCPEFIHNCIDNSIQGIIVPALSFGVVSRQTPHDQYHVDALCDGYPQQHLDEAYHAFRLALDIHDEWERIYIENMDMEKMNVLAAETSALVLQNQQANKTPIEVHRYLGAATAYGSKDYIESLTQSVGKRYFLKGRPGTGKSTFLKKIAADATKRGFDTEIYHCGFDPDSVDMVILREQDVCLFDSTSPHEHFPVRLGDSIIDIYGIAVQPGTDETYAEEISKIAARYQQQIRRATACLASAQSCMEQIQRHRLAHLSQTKVAQVQQEILHEVLTAIQTKIA